jgi:tRNA-splicing ligase RtcB
MRPDSLEQINETLWELPTSFKTGMQVPARIYGTEELIDGMDQGVYDQAANVAALPGIVGYSFCMPDGHWGYGFPIGGTAAFDPEVGIISPGGTSRSVPSVRATTTWRYRWPGRRTW